MQIIVESDIVNFYVFDLNQIINMSFSIQVYSAISRFEQNSYSCYSLQFFVQEIVSIKVTTLELTSSMISRLVVGNPRIMQPADDGWVVLG